MDQKIKPQRRHLKCIPQDNDLFTTEQTFKNCPGDGWEDLSRVSAKSLGSYDIPAWAPPSYTVIELEWDSA